MLMPPRTISDTAGVWLFTTSECEPDAEDYTCDSCEGNTVVGAENALIMGLIDLVPEGEEVE